MAGNGTGEVKRPMRRAAQKLNMSLSSISPASQENNPSKHVGKGNFLVFEINDLFIKSIYALNVFNYALNVFIYALNI